VLDLGAGTGKLTRVLADRYSRVIVVEPLPELRTILGERVPEADVRAGAAERIPLDDAAVDAVFAAQSFHWFANDVAVGEIARVLRPGGVVALLWNRSDDPSPLPNAYRRRIAELHDRGQEPADRGAHPAAVPVRRGARGSRPAHADEQPRRRPRVRRVGELDRGS